MRLSTVVYDISLGLVVIEMTHFFNNSLVGEACCQGHGRHPKLYVELGHQKPKRSSTRLSFSEYLIGTHSFLPIFSTNFRFDGILDVPFTS